MSEETKTYDPIADPLGLVEEMRGYVARHDAAQIAGEPNVVNQMKSRIRQVYARLNEEGLEVPVPAEYAANTPPDKAATALDASDRDELEQLRAEKAEREAAAAAEASAAEAKPKTAAERKAAAEKAAAEGGS